MIWWHCNIELYKQDLQTCDRTDKARWPPDLWAFSKLVPLSLTSRRYLLSDLPVWTHNVHPSLRFQQRLFTAFPLKSPAACLRLASDSPALQSCRACDRLKFQAAPASGDFVEGWIGPDLCRYEASVGHLVLTPGALTKSSEIWPENMFSGRRHKGGETNPVDIPVLVY